MAKGRSTRQRLEALAIGQCTVVQGRRFKGSPYLKVNEHGAREHVTRAMGMTFRIANKAKSLTITRLA